MSHLDTIIIDPSTVGSSCFVSPVTLEMEDVEGMSYYFDVRKGHFTFVNDLTNETVAWGESPEGMEGICTIDEALAMIRNAGVDIRLGE